MDKGIATHNFGLDFTGYEKDPEIFRAQKDRFAAYTAQTSLFTEATP